MRCAWCRTHFALPGDTCGTSDAQESEERVAWESLTRNGRGHCSNVRLRLHEVGAHCTPELAQALANAFAQLSPSGISVLHLGERKCCQFMVDSPPKPMHLSCSVHCLRRRLSFGLAIGSRGEMYALQVGRRPPPFLKLWRALR